MLKKVVRHVTKELNLTIFCTCRYRAVGGRALWTRRSNPPSTPYDWKRELERTKRLRLVLEEKTVLRWHDEERWAVLRPPGDHYPRSPIYFALGDWSAIGRMPSLRSLTISGICVEDFSFLSRCKNLQTLSLYNTNFSDCRQTVKYRPERGPTAAAEKSPGGERHTPPLKCRHRSGDGG